MFEKIANFISSHSEVITGGVFCFLISVLSAKKGTIMNRIVGGILCSLFSTGLYYGILSVFPTVPAYSAVAIGSFVGFVGVDECKRLILARIRYLLTPKKDDDKNE